MMQTTLTIDKRDAVTLPAELRQSMGFIDEGQLIAEITPKGLLLRPAVTWPLERYSAERVREFDGEEAKRRNWPVF